MQSTLTRALVVCVGLAIAGSATAQSTEKDPSAATRQGSSKASSAKPAVAPKRLDFVPGNSVKETATRATTPGIAAPGHTPAKKSSDCESRYSDA